MNNVKLPHILVIDDDEMVCMMLSDILGKEGFEIVVASNGREGLEQCRDVRPDMILLDVMMPEMDGFAVLDVLRTERELSQIPVIVVTAKELTSIEKQRLSGKAQSLMQKGAFNEQDIVDQMLKVLNQ